MRGETKAAMIEEGVKCPDIVAFSVYCTYLVLFLSMVADKLVWNTNEKYIYDTATKKKFKLQLYRTELQFFIRIT